MWAHHGLKSILLDRGVPFIIIRIYPRYGCNDYSNIIDNLLRARRLSGLLQLLHTRAFDVRITTSFSPDKWFEPSRWSQYGYPDTTLYKEIGDPVVRVEPFTVDSLEKPYAYAGMGVVCVKTIHDMRTRGGVREEATPLLVVLLEPLHPRRIVVFREAHPLEIHAYTADPHAINTLLEYGYRELKPFEYMKQYNDPDTMKRELAEIDHKLKWSNNILETYMLEGLHRRVMRYKIYA